MWLFFRRAKIFQKISKSQKFSMSKFSFFSRKMRILRSKIFGCFRFFSKIWNRKFRFSGIFEQFWEIFALLRGFGADLWGFFACSVAHMPWTSAWARPPPMTTTAQRHLTWLIVTDPAPARCAQVWIRGNPILGESTTKTHLVRDILACTPSWT